MATNGMTINGLNPLSALTADDKIPVWDTGASGEPTKEITAQNMANSVKTLGNLVNTTEMNNAIAQSTAKVVANGSVTQGHIYCVHLAEATIANETFEIIYNPNDNQGMQSFSVCLTNRENIYCCTAKISLSNGQLSISDAYRKETGASGVDAWSVSIRVIRMIA